MIEFADGSFDPRAFAHLQNFVLFPTIESTSVLARGVIDHAVEEDVRLLPTVIAARSQSRGRGRRERLWQSPPGGLYATFVFEATPDFRLTLLPLAAAVWTCDAIADSCGVAAGLKWPNDVLCQDRKIAGILTEARTRGEETHVAVGIGVNVLGDPAELGEPRATTAERESGRPPSLVRLFVELCRGFDGFLGNPGSGGVVADWMRRSVHREGDRLTLRVEEPAGARTLSGKYEGLNSDGFLRLSTREGETVVCAGEIQAW